ncbi:Lipase 5 [Sporothrix epigloea]|uniref:Lipase 5 n=1 Tax=Sporothrix epigloea TaxID=1892477 RepID=A0ABP0DY17_9PEZI
MGDFLLLSSDSGRNVNTLQSSAPSIPSSHKVAGLLKRARSQRAASPVSSVAGHIKSITAHISKSFQTRLSQSLKERRISQERQERRQILQLRMSNASCYKEWEVAAKLLDELDDTERWKASSESDEFYNPELIQARLKDLEDARLSSDVRRMMHLVRTALSRDVGGISSPGLYCHTHTGTKYLVERYAKASVELIQSLVDLTRNAASLPKGLTHRTMLDQLLLARRSYGRSALILSGGSVYGMAHIGVLKALFDRGLLPRIISGTSAGSIVAAVVCTRSEEEIPELLERFAHGDLAVFTDKENPDSWLTHIGRAIRDGAWHDSRHIARVMRDLMGDITFQEAFNRTRRILNITVSSKPGLQLPPLLNYLTAPDVIIWSAVVASCSIPGVFDPRPLLVRDAETGEHVPWNPEQLWIDGSLNNDVPVDRLGEMLNVNHFIVSQTNPHIVLFVSKDEKSETTQKSDGNESHSASSVSSIAEIFYTLGWLSKSEAIYYLETLVDIGIFRGGFNMLLQMLNQEYTADINILPRMSLAWGTNLIRNPTTEFMLEACRVGEQATWPSISRIEQACAVELALDKAVHTLRERIAFSDSQVNLRRFFTGSYELGVHGNSLNGGAPLASTSLFAAAGSVMCTVDADDGDTDPALMNRTMSPTSSRSLSPSTYRQSQHLHQRRRHKRRGSGGSIQLSARRRYNLETILSEDGGGQVLDSRPGFGGPFPNDANLSLAVRRGMEDMNFSAPFGGRPKLTHSQSYFDETRPSLPSYQRSPSTYRGAVKQNSLQHLPMSTPPRLHSRSHSRAQTPSPSTSFARRGFNGTFGERAMNGSLTQMSYLAASESFGNSHYYDPERISHDIGANSALDEDGSPLLQMRIAQRQHQRRSSTSSVVLAVSAVATAAVAAAHQAITQAVGGLHINSSAASTKTETQTPRAQHKSAHLYQTSSIPKLAHVSNSVWYPGLLPPSLSRRTSYINTAEEIEGKDEDEEEEDLSGEYDPYKQEMTKNKSRLASMPYSNQTPTRHVRLVRRCKSVPALAGNDGNKNMSQTHQQRDRYRDLPATPLSQRRTLSKESIDHDHTEVDEDYGSVSDDSEADGDDGDVFMATGSGPVRQASSRAV